MDTEGEVFLSSCICGYHVYNDIWTAIVGEELECAREVGNAKDRYVVSVLRGSDIVGHLPQKISRVCSLFLLRGGTISCKVIGRRRYSVDLPQGGLEIPCKLIFRGKKKYLFKIKMLKHVEERLQQL